MTDQGTSRRALRCVLAAVALVASGIALAPSAGAATPPGPFTFNPTNREDVRRLWYSAHEVSNDVPINWTGSLDGCNPGTVNPDFLAATLTRINYFRAMAGVPSNVVFTDANNAEAQAAALIQSGQNGVPPFLSHTPPTTWRCWTQLGFDGSGISNLQEGSTGPQAIDDLMRDVDVLGHRRTILNPQNLVMGSGSVPASPGGVAAEAQLMSADPTPDVIQPARDGFVAWPPRGFVPYQSVFPRWSFVLRGGDFTNATVAMQNADGTPMPVSIQSRASFAGPGIVWLANNLVDSRRDCLAATPTAPCVDTWPKPAADQPITVTVSNVLVNGAPQTFTYTTTIIDPAVADPSNTPLVITGPANPPVNQVSTYSVNAVPNAIGSQWRTSELTPFGLLDGAENGLTNFDAVVGGYNPISNLNVATGTSAFRLTTGQPGGVAGTGPQTLTLKQTIVPDANTQLVFKTLASRLTNISGIAEVSADDGTTWTPLYTEQSTDDVAFTTRTVSLGLFAGQHVRVRFLVQNAGTGNTAFMGNEGWYLDDIGIGENGPGTLFGATPWVLSPVSTGQTFDFTPPDAAAYDINARTQFFGSGPGAWSATTRVSNAVAPTITTQPVGATVADGAGASFTVAAAGSTPLSFAWRFNGAPLVDGVGVSGSTTATLTLTGVHAAQAGSYQVQVTNSAGTVTSDPAVLAVTPPTTVATPLGNALDNNDLTWTTTGDANWLPETAVTHDGVDAAQNGDVSDSQSSSLSTTVTGPATLSFWWKVDSEATFDFLRVTVDGVEAVPGISGNVDWTQQTIPLTAAPHVIRWTYSKDVSVSVGQDSGWVDQVVVTPTAAPPPPPPAPLPLPTALSAALDSTDLTWTTTGDANWASETAVTHDGVDAAQSGHVTDNQSSSVQATVNGPATLSFWWKVDSEATFDFLRVTVDGVEAVPGISGNVDWTQQTIPLTAGPHVIRWTYSKDVSVSVGQDAGWLDQVTVTPG